MYGLALVQQQSEGITDTQILKEQLMELQLTEYLPELPTSRGPFLSKALFRVIKQHLPYAGRVTIHLDSLQYHCY